MRSLNQTRECLSAEDSFLEQPGQLLDKALAKQIARRESELDSLSAPNTKKNNVSVIVRCSTPDPEATCSTNNPAFHFPNQVPEDFSIPLNYLFESFVQCETPPLPPRHPVYPNNTITVHPRGPEVPYTPPRHHQDVSSRDTSLIEGFRSPRISALLEPLIDLGATENTSKMSDLNRMKEECDENLINSTVSSEYTIRWVRIQ